MPKKAVFENPNGELGFKAGGFLRDSEFSQQRMNTVVVKHPILKNYGQLKNCRKFTIKYEYNGNISRY